MTRLSRWQLPVFLGTALVALGGCASCPVASTHGDTTPAGSAEDRQVLHLLAEDYQAQQAAAPIWASQQGDRAFDQLLPNVGPDARATRLAETQRRLRTANEIDEGKLSEAQRLNLALLTRDLKARIESAAFQRWQIPITQQSGPQISLPQLPDELTFTTEKQLQDYIARLESIPEYLRQIEANMRAGLESGRTPPRIVMSGVPQQALSMAASSYSAEPTSHPLYAPFVDADDALARRAQQVIGQDVVPAFGALGAFLRDEYVPGCRESIGASDDPDGLPFYESEVRRFTTLDLSAQEIHELGLREVARIRAEMMDVIARSDFMETTSLSGDELFAAFVAYLRTDPRFYHSTPEELLSGYRIICKRVDAHMPAFFHKLPRLAYGVRPMPEFIAASAPTAYYYPGSIETGVAGYFVANTTALDQRPKYEMIALSMHEAVPGHHHQISIAQELESAGLPEWRSTVDSTAYVEGWALYCERLGLEMGDPPYGLYVDPYDDFGRLSYEMWRALRLVVDTGIHAMGWTRQQAIDFMLANSALSESNVESEVNRYIAWPGQALAYKIGELKIRELRAIAEAKLGDTFDLRAFHDALLWQGPLPLDVLEANIMRWIASQQGAQNP